MIIDISNAHGGPGLRGPSHARPRVGRSYQSRGFPHPGESPRESAGFPQPPHRLRPVVKDQTPGERLRVTVSSPAAPRGRAGRTPRPSRGGHTLTWTARCRICAVFRPSENPQPSAALRSPTRVPPASAGVRATPAAFPSLTAEGPPSPPISTSDRTRPPAEFKHITKRRKRN